MNKQQKKPNPTDVSIYGAEPYLALHFVCAGVDCSPELFKTEFKVESKDAVRTIAKKNEDIFNWGGPTTAFAIFSILCASKAKSGMRHKNEQELLIAEARRPSWLTSLKYSLMTHSADIHCILGDDLKGKEMAKDLIKFKRGSVGKRNMVGAYLNTKFLPAERFQIYLHKDVDSEGALISDRAKLDELLSKIISTSKWKGCATAGADTALSSHQGKEEATPVLSAFEPSPQPRGESKPVNNGRKFREWALLHRYSIRAFALALALFLLIFAGSVFLEIIRPPVFHPQIVMDVPIGTNSPGTITSTELLNMRIHQEHVLLAKFGFGIALGILVVFLFRVTEEHLDGIQTIGLGQSSAINC